MNSLDQSNNHVDQSNNHVDQSNNHVDQNDISNEGFIPETTPHCDMCDIKSDDLLNGLCINCYLGCPLNDHINWSDEYKAHHHELLLRTVTMFSVNGKRFLMNPFLDRFDEMISEINEDGDKFNKIDMINGCELHTPEAKDIINMIDYRCFCGACSDILANNDHMIRWFSSFSMDDEHMMAPVMEIKIGNLNNNNNSDMSMENATYYYRLGIIRSDREETLITFRTDDIMDLSITH
jgi:hypothetical protein